MRPGSSSGSTGSNIWRTPLPYLFGGLGAMMILIAVALVVLACSHRKSAGDRDSAAAAASRLPEKALVAPLDMEPRFVVIMAGESTPSFVAKPTTSLCQEP
ncbi:hypothetical protein BHM03_00012846 [Ensete ventricosum]|uniref:Protein GLUTAMINE DUMPER 4 n=1 Tax=Ensete ventricosum TaxID=4639 RepID=A0A426YZH0_ENSVE|nr:hypothetical protein B296_00032725 [Ensete ventricosum]RZR72349.1 hypothetical protein BHM03_00012846 [Ensete ventricosum]